MTRHYVGGKRLVIEDASLEQLIDAVEQCSSHHANLLQKRKIYGSTRPLDRNIAMNITVHVDIVNEICKRARERRYQ